MLILEIVAALALLFVVVGMITGFGMHCQNKFGFKGLAPATICLWQLYAVLFYVGQAWMASAAQAHGDTLNGMLVAGAALFGALWIVINNYRRTNLLFGTVITVLQIASAVMLVPPLSFGIMIGDHYTENRLNSDAQKVRIVHW